MQYRVIFVLSMLCFVGVGCKQAKDNDYKDVPTSKVVSNVDKNPVRKKRIKRKSDMDYLNEMVGEYVSEGYPDKFYNMITIRKVNRGILHVNINSFNVNSGQGCSFDAEGTVGNGELLIPVLWNDIRIIITMKIRGDGINVYTIEDFNKEALKGYCENGKSLYGHYKLSNSK